MKQRLSSKLLLVGVIALLPVVAMADKINVKTGLWETTTTTDMAGAAMPAMPAIPPETLAKMPPEQRARIEAMLANRGAAAMAQTSQSCVTEQDLERGLRPETSSEQSCKLDSVKTTGSTQEAHISCNNARGNSTGVFKMTATSREAFDGTMDMNAVVNNQPINIKIKLKGKWLGSDCGSVKPREK